MFNKSILLFVFIQSAAAIALAGYVDGNGVMTVNKTLSITNTLQLEKPSASDKQELTLRPGTYQFQVYQGHYKIRQACIPLINCNEEAHREGTPYIELTLRSKSSLKFLKYETSNVYLTAKAESSKNGTVYTSESTGQDFNIYSNVTYRESDSDSRNEVQECSVEVYCGGGGYGYGFGYGYGGCTSAMGTQKVRVHDHLTTRVVQLKFVSLAGRDILASYQGSETGKEQVVESAGKCRLNINQ